MSAVLVLTPVVIGSWPIITAAVAGAAAAMSMTIAKTAAQEVKAEEAQAEQNAVEVEIAEEQELARGLATEEEIVLTKGTVTLRVRRDARGRCTVCAVGHGHTKTELKAMAQEFSQRLTQSFVYNRIMTEVKTKGFQVVNEEQMEDETVRIHLRRWEG